MSGVTVGGAVAYYVWNRLERITTTNDPNLKAADKQLAQVVDPATAAGGRARAGLRQALRRRDARGNSDTLMLIRVDPQTKVLSLLSLPRDLYVHIDGYGVSKINAAYANGGAPLAIKTVSQVLGVKINYYVPVNFHLFRKTVDTFHGVYIDVDRRYYHANNSVGNYSAIDLKPGYQKLSGVAGAASTCATATSTPTSSAPRASRRSCASSSAASTSGRRARNIFDLLDSLPNDLKVRGSAKGQSVGPKTILRYVKLLAEIPRGKMVQVRLDGRTAMVNGASVVTATPRAIHAGRAGVPEPEHRRLAGGREPLRRHGRRRRQEAGRRRRKGPKAIPPTKLRVVTVNGSGVQGVAAHAMIELQKAGWPHTGVARHAPQGEPLLDGRLLHDAARARLRRAPAPLARRHERRPCACPHRSATSGSTPMSSSRIGRRSRA